MKICVMGLGYIGLPTASLLATKGFDVWGVDVNSRVIDTINEGSVHIHEPDLDILVKSAVQSGHLKAGLKPQNADVFIIAVPTPFKGDHEPDISMIEAATKAIAPVLSTGNLIILESTSPVGTTEKIANWLQTARPDLTFPSGAHQKTVAKGTANQMLVAYCPERVLPGQILKELITNDRIVGGLDAASTKAAANFYRKFVSGTVLTTNARTAEMTKLTENAFRDVNIAFANELSLICEKLDINVWDLIDLANRHPRVRILQPGPGVGGHCIAVDPWFIVHSTPDEARLVRTAREINDNKPKMIVHKVMESAKAFKNPVIACLGLSFKNDIDDLRESPAIEIVHALAKKNVGQLLVVEPHVEELPKSLKTFDNVRFVSADEASAAADIIVLLVHHSVFAEIDPAVLNRKVVIDTRGFWKTNVRSAF